MIKPIIDPNDLDLLSAEVLRHWVSQLHAENVRIKLKIHNFACAVKRFNLDQSEYGEMQKTYEELRQESPF